MTIARSKHVVAALVAAVFVLVLPASPAPAEARDAQVVGVYRTATCSGGRCTPGTDTPVAANAIVNGTLQVFVSAKADLGLEFVRLEAQSGSDPAFYCLEFWKTNGALEFSANRVWKTEKWTDPRAECEPGICSGCLENSDHQHGIPTANGDYRLRVVAREQGQFNDQNDSRSALFSVKLSNAPTAPSWIGEPASNGKPDPSVILRWSPSQEPDITEYQFVREDPSGAERVFAVSATNPERNGCSRASDIAYSCANGGFKQSGTYRYAVRALRPGSGTTCAVSKTSCVASKVGPVRSVTVTVAASGSSQQPATTPSGEASASVQPAATATAQEPLALPPDDGEASGEGLIAPPSGGRPAGSRQNSAPAIGLAAGLALAVAVILGRRRMRSGKERAG